MRPLTAAAHSRPAGTARCPACTARFSAPTHVALLRPKGAARRRAPGGRRDGARYVPGANQAAATCVLLGGTHPIGLLRTDILN